MANRIRFYFEKNKHLAKRRALILLKVAKKILKVVGGPLLCRF
jgi:hypothetical protein